jgi:hypothetical protein
LLGQALLCLFRFLDILELITARNVKTRLKMASFRKAEALKTDGELRLEMRVFRLLSAQVEEEIVEFLISGTCGEHLFLLAWVGKRQMVKGFR